MTTAPAPLAVTLRHVVGGADVAARILIEPCRDGSDEWRVVDDDAALMQRRRWKCQRAAKKAKERRDANIRL